mgnify:CR=1 FL=1
MDSTLYTVAQIGDATQKDGTTTTIKFDNANSLNGKTIVVSYTGTVTKDALTDLGGSVDNKATVVTNGGASGEGKTESKTYGFQFTKIGVDKDANALAGAKFVVKKDGSYLAQDENGAWSLTKDKDSAKVFTSAKTTGLVQIKGLAAGTYTVEETEAPTATPRTSRSPPSPWSSRRTARLPSIRMPSSRSPRRTTARRTPPPP